MAASDFIGKTFVVTQRHVGNVRVALTGPIPTWREVGDVCVIIDARYHDTNNAIRGSFGITCLYASGISTIYASDDEANAFCRWFREINAE